MPTIRRPTGAKGLSAEAIERELAWREWFPQDVHWAPVKVQDEETVERLFTAFYSFCQANMKVRYPGKGMIPLDLRPAQIESVKHWLRHRMSIELKARQIGFSTLAACFCLWRGMGWADNNILILSKGQREARKLLNKARYAYRKMPEWVRLRGPRLIDKTLERMTFDNETIIESLPSSIDPARGESADIIIIDEWAFLNNQEEAWGSIEPVADLGGRIIGLSTANGEDNDFFNRWGGALAGMNGFAPLFIGWWGVPERDEEWFAEKCRVMDHWQRCAEYPATADEAFVGSGHKFFDIDRLSEMQVSDPIARIDIHYNPGTRYAKTEEKPDGELLVWEYPQSKASYVVGADVAMGLDTGDWSVAWVMDATSGRLVAVYRSHIDPDLYGSDILPGIGYYYNNALVCAEVNNHGLTTLKAMQRAGYTRLYRRRTAAKRQERFTEAVGYQTNYANKPKLMDFTAEYLRTHNVPHRETVAELRGFVRDQKGERVKLHGSPHDDLVMALAFCVEARDYAIKNAVFKVKDHDVPGSIAWWAKKLDKNDVGVGRRQRRGLRVGI